MFFLLLWQLICNWLFPFPTPSIFLPTQPQMTDISSESLPSSAKQHTLMLQCHPLAPTPMSREGLRHGYGVCMFYMGICMQGNDIMGKFKTMVCRLVKIAISRLENLNVGLSMDLGITTFSIFFLLHNEFLLQNFIFLYVSGIGWISFPNSFSWISCIKMNYGFH